MAAGLGISRRQFLRAKSQSAPFRPRPPGVNAQSLSACTGCGHCVSACPQGIVALQEDAVALVPDRGACTFCGDCAAACPEPVFGEAPAMAHVMAITSDCFAEAGITCMTCRDVCPEAAISMRPRIGTAFLPVLDAAACSGCGACVTPCPADAIVASAEKSGHD